MGLIASSSVGGNSCMYLYSSSCQSRALTRVERMEKSVYESSYLRSLVLPFGGNCIQKFVVGLPRDGSIFFSSLALKSLAEPMRH